MTEWYETQKQLFVCDYFTKQEKIDTKEQVDLLNNENYENYENMHEYRVIEDI